MRITELLRLAWININQNKFKSILTSIGIVVGAATIVLVIGIGQGGQKEVAEQFAELNAGAIDVSYEYEGEDNSKTGFSFGNMGRFFGSLNSGENSGNSFWAGKRENGATGSAPEENSMDAGPAPEESGMNIGSAPEENSMNAGPAPEENSMNAGPVPKENGMNTGPAPEESRGSKGEQANSSGEGQDETEEETSMVEDRLNQENFVLTQEDVEDIERYVTGITGATISYSTRASVEGGDLESAQTYTVAGVKERFLEISKLELDAGDFLTEEEDQSKARICVLGSDTAIEIFGSTDAAYGQTLYVNDRTYLVSGILKSSQTVSAGISPDTAILIPYETGIKYITGTQIKPVVTVIAQDVDVLENVMEEVAIVLEENHVNARFTFTDAGSKMQAAQSSNRTLTMLLSAMAVIVFFVGGIGIMNVLFVSVKERTNEIGILKAIGTSRSNILIEFLIESAAISFIGGVLGVMLSFAVIPAARWMDVRVEVGIPACLAALGFSVLTGTVFGIYPAWKASRLEPVEALNAE